MYWQCKRMSLLFLQKKVTREKRIPFEVSLDPFYESNNIAHLERIMKEIKEGECSWIIQNVIMGKKF